MIETTTESGERARSFTVKPAQKMRVVKRHYYPLKRVFDVAVCTVLLVIALPLMLVIAALVWITNPGPVVFVQQRTGKHGRRFSMYKFRTMYKDAEDLKKKYLHLNELTWPDFKITNDPRITRIGRFLRRTSLDELPQIFNVLKGDMSLVGPRPTSFAAATYLLHHTERLEVVPGVTGLWQVSGRSNIDFDDRLLLDIEYIEKQSMWFDLQLLWRTVAAIVSRRGAH